MIRLMVLTGLLFITAYFIAAPLGYYVVLWKTGKDLRQDFREIGASTSSGATNVKRVLGTRWAIIAGFGDFLKGALPTFLAIFFLWGLHWIVGLIGLVSLLGNRFPVLISNPRFKGGKGVATTAGALTPMAVFSLIKYHPLWILLLFVLILLLWGFFVWVLREPNHQWMVLASTFLTSAMILFFGILELKIQSGLVLSVYLMGIIVIWNHFENWLRLKEYLTKKKSPSN